MIELPNAQIKLGKKLQEECPQNDCIVYRNIFERYEEMTNDLEIVKAALCSESTIRAVEVAILKDIRELTEMYFENYAVQLFKETMRGKQNES